MTLTASTERCLGCGAIVPMVDGPIHRYMTSAPGCWAAYGELSAHLLSDATAGAYRQLCVDAYAVQHPGQPGPQATQSVGGHLVSLLAQLELNLPASRSVAVLERGIKQKGFFSPLAPPSFDAAYTVLFMRANLNAPAWAARQWAVSAWRAWAAHHEQVRAWYDDLSR
ncbi:MAG: DUF5946 family protein [Gemmatimonadaceae bacterium]